jgi:hypothetical protein
VTQPPSSVDQVAFLTQVQRVLDEGQFVATYKFALLVALIEVAIERGNDSGASLEVKVEWLAEKFIELYWGHSKPFNGAVLSQNNGVKNVAVLGRIQEIQTTTMSLAGARRAPQWRATVGEVAKIIQTMPLVRLQLLRGDQRIEFLYDGKLVDGSICLRRASHTACGSSRRSSERWHEMVGFAKFATTRGTRTRWALRRAWRPSCSATNAFHSDV